MKTWSIILQLNRIRKEVNSPLKGNKIKKCKEIIIDLNQQGLLGTFNIRSRKNKKDVIYAII